MKCVCGYEHSVGIDEKGNGDSALLKGDEAFILIENHERSGYISTFETPMRQRSTMTVKLYACPKCLTVKLSKQNELP